MRKLIIPLLLAILALQMISAAWAWEIERPGGDIGIKERTDSAYTNGEASVGLGVAINNYYEQHPDYNEDYVHLNISMTANSRKGITYAYSSQSLWWIPENELWYRSDSVGAGDDVVIPVDIPQNEGYFAFRFYGGLGSAEYKKVYVSTNGFISFHNSTQPSPSPQTIPSTAEPEPNALIAAVWTDLNIDSSASIITGLYAIASRWYFVIIWNNALHKASGQRLTFQIILEDAPQYYPVNTRYSQSQIWISYKSVSSINTDFAYGIEDQQGRKGVGGLYSGSSLGSLNGTTLRFSQSSNSFFLEGLTLSFQDANSETEFNILEENGYYLRGHNIERNIYQLSEADGTYMFATALAGTATLLISAFSPWGWLTAAGFIVDTVLVGSDWFEYLAYRQYSGRQVEVLDRDDGLQQQANATALTYDYAVDASLSVIVHWILKTENNVGTHELTITANLEYYEYSIIDGSIINKPPTTTSVNLEIGPDDNDSFSKAQEILKGTYSRLYIGGYDTQDYYKIFVREGQKIDVSAWATQPSPTSPEPSFNLFIYDPGGNLKASTGYSSNSQSLSYTADSTGDWFIEVCKDFSYGFYSLEVHVYYYPGGGGPGCPYVSTWDGSEYVLDNNLIPAAEHSNGTDVIDYYKLQQPLIRDEGKYSLLISDVDKHSYLDKVQLVTVDHDPAFNIAVTPHGEILTYGNSTPPQTATTKDDYDVTDLIETIDDDLYYGGWPDDYLTVDFGDLDITEGAKLLVRADPLCEPLPCKLSIHVQVLKPDGWTDVATFIPRTYWSTDIVDLSAHLPDINGELKVRLYFTGNHKIDYIGLDTTKQGEFETRYANLASAVHSNGTDMKEALMSSDNIYVELFPGEKVKLDFTLPKSKEDQRDFIIIIEGHYFTIS